MKLPQFVPILTSFAARVAGCETVELLQSAAVLARALVQTQLVVGHDGVLCHFDPSLLFRACIKNAAAVKPQGSAAGVVMTPAEDIPRTEPLSTVLESVPALRYQLPNTAKIFATFTGPGLLYSLLRSDCESHPATGEIDPDYVVDVVRSAVRSSLELKADGIALIEQPTSALPPQVLRSHKLVRKLADFYDAGFLVFALPGFGDQDFPLPAHCIFDLPSATTGIGRLIGRLGPSTTSAFIPFTTPGDVPAATAVEDLKALTPEMRSG